jgi:hypothetical protein
MRDLHFLKGDLRRIRRHVKLSVDRGEHPAGEMADRIDNCFLDWLHYHPGPAFLLGAWLGIQTLLRFEDFG